MKEIKSSVLSVWISLISLGVVLVLSGCKTTYESSSEPLSSSQAPTSEPMLSTKSAKPRSAPTAPYWPTELSTEESAINGINDFEEASWESSVSYVEPLDPEWGPSAAEVDTAEEAERYEVKKGDTLWGLAKEKGTSVRTLCAINDLPLDHKLSLGETILLPASSSPSSAAYGSSPKPSSEISGDTYEIKSGDTLSIIAKRVGISVQALKAANNLSSDRIFAGETLIIPRGKTLGNDSSGKGATQPLPVKEAVSVSSSTYQVREGDTLGTIAKTQGVSVKALMALNGIQDPKRLRAGQQLRLSADNDSTVPVVTSDAATVAEASVTKSANALEIVPVDSEAPLIQSPAASNSDVYTVELADLNEGLVVDDSVFDMGEDVAVVPVVRAEEA